MLWRPKESPQRPEKIEAVALGGKEEERGILVR
jgi:hypothetical protein